MSLASELLFNHIGHSVGEESDRRGSAEDALGRWYNLNHVVYALIGDHEPDPNLVARLRADIQVMQLSGLINEFSPNREGVVYKDAAQVMSQLLKLLPRTRE